LKIPFDHLFNLVLGHNPISKWLLI